MGLTGSQKVALIIIERAMSSISVTATILLIITYLSFKDFRTLPNTIIFLASPANLLAGVAALIGGSGLKDEDGSTCQAQAFLLEWFMQADPFWSLVAAITVFLVFFRRWGAERIKRLYWVYILFCYGLPMIAAVACLVYKKNGPMYGNSVLWCWIDTEYAWARIYTYYAPIWLSIFLSLSIYFCVGVRVYKTRSQLNEARNNAYYATGTSTVRSSTVRPPSMLMINQTTDIYQTVSNAPSTIKYPDPIYQPASISSTSATATPTPPATASSGYTATVAAPSQSRNPIQLLICCLSRTFHLSIFGLKQAIHKWQHMDEVKYKYTKCAGLFAISVLVTWVPSSFNRVYGIIHPNGRWIFPLNIASAVVLPLQGFWNFVIFFSTSMPIVRMVWSDIGAGRRVVWVGKMMGWEERGGGGGVNVPLVDRRPSVVESQRRLRGGGGTGMDDESFLGSL